MCNWHICKNNDTASPCWQLYHNTDDGRRRYYDRVLDYPTAASLRDALMDSSIRDYATNYVQISNAETSPSNKSFEYRKRHFDVYRKMINLSCKYGAKSGIIYERLIINAIEAE